MKLYLKFGLILGALLAAFPLILFAIGMDKEESVQTISTVVNLVIISSVLWVGIKQKRDTENRGFISFGAGFGTGFKITLIASIISAISSYLYFTVVNPGMLTYIRMKQEEELLDRGMSDEQVAKMAEGMDAWMSPPAMVAFSFGGMLILGTVITLIVAAILKKEDPAAEIS
jgi:hypothetical protein